MHKRHMIICIKGTNKSLLRVNSSLSVMLYYPSDLKSLRSANAVKICVMNVQTVQLKRAVEVGKNTCALRPLPPPHPLPGGFVLGARVL